MKRKHPMSNFSPKHMTAKSFKGGLREIERDGSRKNSRRFILQDYLILGFSRRA
jgi:hypothetical protein